MPLPQALIIILVLGYLYYLGQVAIHNCVHYSLFKTKKLNRSVGLVLCSMQLTHFDGWRAAHMMHHRFAQSERDPHRVDRYLLHYILTHYYRIAKYTWEPKRYFMAVAPPVLLALGVIAWQAALGEPLRGVVWVGVFWLIPVMISHALVAHFNFITHAELPYGRGHDTRSFNEGIWRVINKLTFNFYLHAEHHFSPSVPVPQPDPRFYEPESMPPSIKEAARMRAASTGTSGA